MAKGRIGKLGPARQVTARGQVTNAHTHTWSSDRHAKNSTWNACESRANPLPFAVGVSDPWNQGLSVGMPNTIYEMIFGKVDEPLSDPDEDNSSPRSGGERRRDRKSTYPSCFRFG